jgi:hypothetical protein
MKIGKTTSKYFVLKISKERFFLLVFKINNTGKPFCIKKSTFQKFLGNL